jgi:WXG100 family type VII secretion target
MTLTVSQVLSAKPEVLLNAAGDVGTVANQLEGKIADQRSQLSRLAGSWTGSASAAAQKQGAQMLVGQEAYRDKLRAMQQVMSSGGQQLSTVRTQLQSLVGGSISPLLNVADNGSVTPGPVLQQLSSLSPVLGMQVKLKSLEVETAVKKLLDEFEKVDKGAADALRKFLDEGNDDKQDTDDKQDDGNKPDDKPETPTEAPAGQNPADIAKGFLDRNASDLKGSGELPMDPSVPNDVCCANFVTATLQKAGLIDWHSNGVADMSSRLQAEGWRVVPASEARPGDVAVINGSEHTELVASTTAGRSP